MNNQNIKTWEASGKLYLEWGDCSLDDEDRYGPTSCVITVSVDLLGASNNRELMKIGKTKLCIAYDLWVQETRV